MSPRKLKYYSALIRSSQLVWFFTVVAGIKLVSMPFYAVPLGFKTVIYVIGAALFLLNVRDLSRPIPLREIERLDEDIHSLTQDIRTILKRIASLLKGGRTS